MFDFCCFVWKPSLSTSWDWSVQVERRRFSQQFKLEAVVSVAAGFKQSADAIREEIWRPLTGSIGNISLTTASALWQALA